MAKIRYWLAVEGDTLEMLPSVNHLQMRRPFRFLVFSFICLLVSSVYSSSSPRVIKLDKTTNPLGQVSHAVASSGGVDFAAESINIKKHRFFADKAWYIALVESKRPQLNSGWVILKNVDGIYQPVLGPGTAFAYDDVVFLPPDLLAYLLDLGVVYDL